MNPINEKTITFNPVTGKLTINVLGKECSASIRPCALHDTAWTLPHVVAQLLEPLRITVAVSWNFVETEGDVLTLISQERELQETLAQAFYWATSDINSLDNVRLVKYNDLKRIIGMAYAGELAKNIEVAA